MVAAGSARRDLDPKWIILVGSSALLAFLAIVPILAMLWGSVTRGTPGEQGALTLAHYASILSAPGTYQLLLSSCAYAGGAALLALVLGGGMAWLVERTNMPYRQAFYVIALLPIINPGILQTISWLLLLDPRAGLINRALATLGLPSPLFDIYSLGGMIWVSGVSSAPLVFILLAAALHSMDPALEDAGAVSGASVLGILRRVTLPILIPAVAATGLIIFVRGLESFETPAIVGVPAGIPVFTSEIWRAVERVPSDYGRASTLGVILLLVTSVGVFLYTRTTSRVEAFATIGGKGFRPRVLELGRWRSLAFGALSAYSLVAIFLPLLVLVWASLQPFYRLPSLSALHHMTLANYTYIIGFPEARRAFFNSIILAVGTATVAMCLTAAVAWITVRTEIVGRQVLSWLALAQIVVPGLVLGLSFIWLYSTLPIPIYGTIWILMLAYVTKSLPYAMGASTSSLVQVHRELEEVAQTSGASWLQTLRRVVLPLIKPGFLAGWLYILIVSSRELSTSILLYSSSSVVIPVLIFDLWSNGQIPELSALSVLLLVVLVLLAGIAVRSGAKIGIRD